MYCSVNHCGKPNRAGGMCVMHYQRTRKYGNPHTLKSTAQVRHGLGKHPLYGTYAMMLDRCTNPNHIGYKSYGGRGIRVCAKWLGNDGLKNFIEDMGPRPKGRSIDRIDNNGNYEPSNCRWATRSQQQTNKRRKPTKSGYLGVYYDNLKDIYYARIQLDGRYYFGGMGKDPEQVALKADAMRIQLVGGGEALNYL